MEVETRDVFGSQVVKICEERLDVKSVPSFREAIEPYIDSEQTLILDLSVVQFIDSTGVGALLQLMKNLNEKESPLKLCDIQEQVESMFKLVHMETMFVICKSVEEATGLG